MSGTADSSMSAFTEPFDPKRVLLMQVASMNLTNDKLESVLLDDRPHWAFSNMFTYAGADVVIEAALDARPQLYNFHRITDMWLIFCPIIIASFIMASQLFRFMPGLRTRYRAFKKDERMVAIFHVIFALSFAAKIVPQTIWTVHLLWGPSFAVQFNDNYVRLWGCAVTNALMYISEGVTRSVIRVNPFLLAHHLFYFIFFIVPCLRNSVWGSKLILLLDCFIVLCELPLYLSLLAHRFIISTRKVQVITWVCMAWSVALRILELVILVAYFAGTYKRMKFWGETQMWGWFLALSVPGGFVTCTFSFGIFIWFLMKRNRNPEKYGASRYNLPERGPRAVSSSRRAFDDGSLPSKLDP